jgi:hypothetical protein
MINKTFAKIVCIIVVVATVGVIIWANMYSAPYRAVEDYFTALGNGDERMFQKYAFKNPDFEKTYTLICEKTGFSVEEKPDFKVKYVGRKKDGERYLIDIVLTAYSDERYTEAQMKISVAEDGFNYKIAGQEVL